MSSHESGPGFELDLNPGSRSDSAAAAAAMAAAGQQGAFDPSRAVQTGGKLLVYFLKVEKISAEGWQ